MKKLSILNTIAVLISLLVLSCEKDDSTNSTDYSDVVADEIAASASNVTGGMSIASGSYDEYTSNDQRSASLDTVFQKEKTFTKISSPLAPYSFSFSYTVHFGIVLNSSTKIIDNMFYNSDASGNFNNSVVTASITENSKWKLTGFEVSSSSFILNGTGTLKGNSLNKIKGDSIISTSNIKFENILINKTTDEITDGTLNWDISGTVNGESFKYSATLVFTNGTEAELTLSGNKYYINISTGKVTDKE